MTITRRSLVVSLVLVLVPSIMFSQDDEVRQGTGLPIEVGNNVRAGDRMNVSGRIVVEGVKNLPRPPIITVIIHYAGATADRTITNDAGYYVIRNVPRNNVSIVVEVDGVEVARQPIMSPPMGNPRIDYTVPWPPAASITARPGVISAEQGYKRSGKNEELYQKATTALKSGDKQGAVTLFDQLLAADPKDYVAWTELGTIFFKAGSFDNAEACYFKAIELKKDYSVALLNLGKLYLTRKQFDNAIIALSNAVKAAPTSADAHQYLGESYLQAKKGSSALFHLNEAIKLAPTEKADLHLRIATLYDAAKQKDKAAVEYKAYLAKNPTYPDKDKLELYIKENSASQ